VSGKKQREVRQWERRREGEQEEPLSKRTINLPLSLDRAIEDEANASHRTFSEVAREQLGSANAKLTPGPAPKVEHNETTNKRITFSTVYPEDMPLPIDTRNHWFMRQIFLCLGGRFRHGTQIYPHPPQGSGYLMLWDEPGQAQCMYHFPLFDKPGLEHTAFTRRFDAITSELIPLSESKRLAHPDYKEWKRLREDLYNFSAPSVTMFLVKAIWQECCYSALRMFGHSTPNALVTRGQYDEKLKGNAMWLAPGSTHYVDAEKDVSPYEILQRQIAAAS
jgi:hypothetical protein